MENRFNLVDEPWIPVADVGRVSLRQVFANPSYRSLGGNPVYTFFRITLPLIAPGVISGGLFAFAASFDEVVVTLFLAGPDQTTLPRQMFAGIKENISPTIAAAATVLILFSIVLLLTLEWLRGRSEKMRTAASAA